MNISNVAAQLYSFRDFITTKAGVGETLRRLREMGYCQVQLSGSIAPMSEEELKQLLAESGLTAVTSHDRAEDIINTPEKVAERLAKLGCFHTAYPFPHWLPSGEAETVELARQINRAALAMKPFGVTLAYHNHSQEFRRFHGRTMLEIIYENAPDVDGEPDTFWIQRGGGDPVRWIEQLSGRLQVLHLKDYAIVPPNEIVMASIGDGNLDWKAILNAAKKSGTKCFVVEHDGNCPDPFESFRRSLDYLKKLHL